MPRSLPVVDVLAWLAVFVITACTGPGARAVEPPATAAGSGEGLDFFENRIRPVLVERCYECHSGDSAEGELRLDSRAGVQRGGRSGRVLVPFEPQASLLIRALAYRDDDLQMPPDGQLPASVIEDFQTWIQLGAPDPRDGQSLPEDAITVQAAQHWSFQPPRLAQRPSLKNVRWPRTDIDWLIAARLESHGIDPAPLADPRTQLRRLYYDLTGLPPSFEQVAAFAADPSDEAYAQIVDRLLASPHFGERWARHWLDVSRFGDTKGYVFREDRNYPQAYRYRDWVIDALNQDLPYDQFVMHQIAADHLPSVSREDLAAMGYLTLGRRFLNNKHDIIDDRIDVVFRGMMGLTVACARCHDHKYDPIPTVDYYSLYGIFSSSQEKQEDDLPLRLVDAEQPADARVFLRGSPRSRGEVAPRNFLSYFRGSDVPPIRASSGRLELAQAIACADNPLTARVLVNRVWSHLFGRPLVSTPSDFGLRSDRPVQQDVLDHLAVRFVQQQWSIKGLLRQLVSSSTYRQQSSHRPAAAAIEPENALYWRAHRRRLDFESMRDSLLAVSGQLDPQVKGESQRIDSEDPTRRRTLYAFIDRQNLPAIFRTFDFASPDTHSPQRPVTIVPQQGLYLMNNHWIQSISEACVRQVAAVPEDAQRIGTLFRLILGREPTPQELQLGQRFLAEATQPVDPPAEPGAAELPTPLPPWAQYAQALLLTNEFMYLD